MARPLWQHSSTDVVSIQSFRVCDRANEKLRQKAMQKTAMSESRSYIRNSGLDLTSFNVPWKDFVSIEQSDDLPLQIIIHCVTYAGEPQRRVRDFCFSLSDLSELRQALNFPSRAALLGLATLKYRRAVKSKTKKTPSMLQQCQFFSNPFLEFCLSKPPKFFFHHLVPHVCPSI